MYCWEGWHEVDPLVFDRPRPRARNAKREGEQTGAPSVETWRVETAMKVKRTGNGILPSDSKIPSFCRVWTDPDPVQPSRNLVVGRRCRRA